jgi:uncharacterized membrane protein
MPTTKPSEEENVNDGIVYARTLKIGVWLSLLLVVITFLLYVFNFIPSHVPLEQLPNYWNLSASEFRLQTGTPAGVGQARFSGESDLLCLIAIAVLSTISLISLTTVLVRYVARRDLTYAVIAGLNIAVLVLAACGVFGR